MTIAITHAFISAKGDGTDATLVRPSDWNASHSTSVDSGQLIGRLSAGIGAFEEIPISAFMASLLAAADAPTLAGLIGLYTTGDVKYTFSAAPSNGWILINGFGSIGSAASGATLRANADTLALYTLVYNNCADGYAPVSGGRTGNATNDFNANKILTLPQLLGRSPIGAGNAQGGLTTRVLGSVIGEENHLLSTTEMPSHYHSASIYAPGHTHGVSGGVYGGTSMTSFSPPGFSAPFSASAIVINTAFTGVRVNSSNGLDTTYSAGGGGAHNNMHPAVGLNVMVKL